MIAWKERKDILETLLGFSLKKNERKKTEINEVGRKERKKGKKKI